MDARAPILQNRTMRSRTFRLLILLAVAAAIALFYFTRDAGPPGWEQPLRVVIYPENADGSAPVRAYIDALQPDRFQAVEDYMAQQAARYDLGIEKPFVLELADPIKGAPKAPDYQSFWTYLSWGISLRWWYWTFDGRQHDTDIIVICRYRARESSGTLHSLGIPSMNLAVANLQAGTDARGLNNVVVAHELLHTVGASDLYDLETGLPEYPKGYVDPNRDPLHPQPKAELMAGRIPVDQGRAVQATRLEQVVIGAETAGEIGWLEVSESE